MLVEITLCTYCNFYSKPARGQKMGYCPTILKRAMPPDGYYSIGMLKIKEEDQSSSFLFWDNLRSGAVYVFL